MRPGHGKLFVKGIFYGVHSCIIYYPYSKYQERINPKIHLLIDDTSNNAVVELTMNCDIERFFKSTASIRPLIAYALTTKWVIFLSTKLENELACLLTNTRTMMQVKILCPKNRLALRFFVYFLCNASDMTLISDGLPIIRTEPSSYKNIDWLFCERSKRGWAQIRWSVGKPIHTSLVGGGNEKIAFYFDYECFSKNLAPFAMAMQFEFLDGEKSDDGNFQNEIYILFEKFLELYCEPQFFSSEDNGPFFCQDNSKKYAHKRYIFYALGREMPFSFFLKDNIFVIVDEDLKNIDKSSFSNIKSMTNFVVIWHTFFILFFLKQLHDGELIGKNYDKTLILFAHNGGRFDFVILLKFLIFYLAEQIFNVSGDKKWIDINDFQYFQNNNRIVGFDCHPFERVYLSLRDSILFVCTNSKSLAGAASELRLSQQKMVNSFHYMDFLICCIKNDWYEEANLLTRLNLYLLENLDKEEEALELFEVMRLKCGGRLLFSDLFFNNLLEYVMQDVRTLFEILDFISYKILMPYVEHLEFKKSNVFHHRSLSSLMYFECLIRIEKSIERSMVQYPLDKSAGIFRKAIYGGRCQSSIVGGLQHSKLLGGGEMDTEENMREYSVLLVEFLKNEKIASWLELIDWVFFVKDYDVSIIPSWLFFLFENVFVHIDICSMYPSSLCAPFAVGNILPISEGMKAEIDAMLQNRGLVRFNPYKFPPFVMTIIVSASKERLSRSILNCSDHNWAEYSSLPFHFEKKTQGQANLKHPLHRDGLHWIVGESICGVFCSLDIYNLLSDGFLCHVKFSEVGYFFDGGWHEDCCAKFFKHMFELKKEGAREGNLGKKACGKIALNATYGSSLTNVSTKSLYVLAQQNVVDLQENYFSSCKKLYNPTYDPCTGRNIGETHPCEDNILLGLKKGDVGGKFLERDACPLFENKKLTHMGMFCLAGSRIMFRQMRDMVTRGGRICNSLFGDGHYTRTVYADTDSLTSTLGSCLFGLKKKYLNSDIGSMNVEKVKYKFGIVLESISGNECSSLLKEHGITFPCLVVPIVFAKKIYFEMCINCGEVKLRIKGHALDGFNVDLKNLTTWKRICMYTAAACKIQTFNYFLAMHNIMERDILKNSLMTRFLMERYFKIQVPSCWVNDELKNLTLREHCRRCPFTHDNLYQWTSQDDYHKRFGTRRLKFPSLHSFSLQNENEEEYLKLFSERRSLSVTLLKSGEGKSWTIEPSLLKRSLFIVPQYLCFSCPKCHDLLPLYLTNPYMRDSRNGF